MQESKESKDTEEIWKDIKGYEGLYQVSSEGRVKILDRVTTGKGGRKYHRKERILKYRMTHDGYLQVGMSNKDGRKYLSVHRLVAKAFIKNPENKPQVNHKDEVKTNNCVDNLEWMTAKENCNYGTRNERAGKASGKARSKPVIQYTKDGELVKVWSSTYEVERQRGFSHNSISLVARGIRKTCGGFVWKYVENTDK